MKPRFRLHHLVMDALKRKGLRQVDLGDESPQITSAILTGNRRLSIRRALAWEKVLDITAENLLFSQVCDDAVEERAKFRAL